MPTDAEIVSILDRIRILGANTHKNSNDHEHINKLVSWYSRKLTQESTEKAQENRVALSVPIIRAYISHCENCKNCEYDCQSIYKSYTAVIEANNIRGPCFPSDIMNC